jgi:hypothetical protein
MHIFLEGVEFLAPRNNDKLSVKRLHELKGREINIPWRNKAFSFLFFGFKKKLANYSYVCIIGLLKPSIGILLERKLNADKQ